MLGMRAATATETKVAFIVLGLKISFGGGKGSRYVCEDAYGLLNDWEMDKREREERVDGGSGMFFGV